MLYHQNSLAQVKRGSRRWRRLPDLLARRRGGSTAARARPRRGRGSTSRWRRCRARAAGSPVRKVDCTEQVTAGRIVRERTRAALARRARARCGVCLARASAGVSPTTFEDRRVRSHRAGWPARRPRGGLAAQHRVALEQLALIDRRAPPRAPRVEPAALGEEGDRVVPDDASRCRPRRCPLSRISATVFGTLSGSLTPQSAALLIDDALGAVLLHQRDHARLVHLGVGIDRVAGPAAGRRARAAASPRCCGR